MTATPAYVHDSAAGPEATGLTTRRSIGGTIRYGYTETVHGLVLLAATERGVCALRFDDDGAALEEIRSEFDQAVLVEDLEAVSDHLQAVRLHLDRMDGELRLPLDVAATDFQRMVWSVLLKIPLGETRTYGELAALVGGPGAVRAVGRACALNPVAVAIPCHRVLRSSGDLSGYRWNVDRKRSLLEQEFRAVAWGGIAR